MRQIQPFYLVLDPHFSYAILLNPKFDPEAAHIVLHCGLSVHMIPLDVTHRAIVTNEVLTQLRSTCMPGSNFCQMLVDLMLFFYERYKTVFRFKEGPPLHDPCAVAYVVNPSLFQVKEINVEVVMQDGHACGQTVGVIL